MTTLCPEEQRAIDVLISIPAAPPFVVDARGIVDEAASDVPRRAALAEIAELKERARRHSNAVADAYEARVRGVTLRAYTLNEAIAVTTALHAVDLGHMVVDAVKTRLRAVEIQAWMRAESTQHEAA